jgi:hypothetical protein
MSPESNVPNAEQPDLWARQQSLTAELRELQASGASEDEIAAKADSVNRNVAELVDSGQLGAEDGWSLSAGDNPYLAREEGHQEPEL